MKGGYPLPLLPITQEENCLTIFYPDDDNIRLAIYGQLIELTKWWNWRKTEGTEASETAQILREFFPFRVIEGCTMFDCSDVENCLTTSAIVADINNLISTNSSDIALAQSSVIQLQTAINGAGLNVYPDPPDRLTNPSALCNASWYITDKVINFIDQTLQDASTITLDEFLSTLLSNGGWRTGALKLFWDYIIANTYPNLLTDIQNSRTYIAEAFYCNELDIEGVIITIDANTNITEEAQAGIIGALQALDDSKLALWVAIGQLIETAESCITFCPVLSSVTFDTLTADNWTLTWSNDGSTIIPINPQDETTGNPAPSLKVAYIKSGNYYGLNGTVDITFDTPITLNEITAQFRYYQPVNNVVARYLTAFDENNNIIENYGSSANNAPRNTWNTMTLSGAMADVKRISVKISLIGTQSGTWNSSTVYGWIDNITWTA